MSTSVSENTTTKKIESDVSHYSPMEFTSFLLNKLEELFKQLHNDETTKQEEPIYHVPKPFNSQEEPIYHVPKPFNSQEEPIYHVPKPFNSDDNMPKSLASRPLPPPPNDLNSTYEKISSPKDSAKTKTSLHQAKVRLLKVLQHCLRTLNKIFSAIWPNQSDVSIKKPTDDPVLSEKLKLIFSESKFSELGTLESLQDLIQSLENVIFVLEGRVAASEKVYNSKYGDKLGTQLTQSIAEAKFDLDQAKARLAEVKDLKKEEPLTNLKSASISVSTENNRSTFFGKTASTSTMIENDLYNSEPVKKP